MRRLLLLLCLPLAIYAQLGGSAGVSAGSSSGSATDFAVSATSSVLTVAAGSHQINGVTYSRAACTVTVTGGSPTGLAVVYVDENGTVMVVGPTGLTATASGPCVYTTSASPAVPDANSYWSASIVVTAGSLGAVTDKRARTTRNVQVGDGLQMDSTKTTTSVDSTVARRPGSNIWTGDNDCTACTRSAPHRKGSGAPAASCSVGDTYFRTDATAGQNLYLCTATNTWTQILPGALSNTMVQFIASAPSASTTATTSATPIFTGTLSRLPAGGCAVIAARMLNGGSASLTHTLLVGANPAITLATGSSATNITINNVTICNRPGVQNAQSIAWDINGTLGNTTAAWDLSTSNSVTFQTQTASGTSAITIYQSHGEAPQ